eukprot:3253927-Prorocentrum_lima.AAC.1
MLAIGAHCIRDSAKVLGVSVGARRHGPTEVELLCEQQTREVVARCPISWFPSDSAQALDWCGGSACFVGPD